MNLSSYVYLCCFDIDCVLTNRFTKKVEYIQILDYLLLELVLHHPLGLHSGRGIPFIQVFVDALEERFNQLRNAEFQVWTQDTLPDERIFQALRENGDIFDDAFIDYGKYLFVSGEKGTVKALISPITGKLEASPRERLLPANVQKRFQRYVKLITSLIEKRYSDCFFVDKKKLIFTNKVGYLFTAEMKDGFQDQAKFIKTQQALAEEMETLLSSPGINLSLHFQIKPTGIAIDAEPKIAGKKLGILSYLEWLVQFYPTFNNLFIDCFGDTYPDDFQMPETLWEKGIDTIMWYLGTKPIDREFPFPVMQASAPLTEDKGTRFFLQTFFPGSEMIHSLHEIERKMQ